MTRLGRRPTPPEVRFFPRVRQNGDCWIWIGSTDRAGYGYFWNGHRQVKAHRWSYEFLVAEVPEGLQLDHLCRTPSCVNPWHLDPVTPQINTLRGDSVTAQLARRDTCKNGHPLTAISGRRICRTCRRDVYSRYRARKKEIPA